MTSFRLYCLYDYAFQPVVALSFQESVPFGTRSFQILLFAYLPMTIICYVKVKVDKIGYNEQIVCQASSVYLLSGVHPPDGCLPKSKGRSFFKKIAPRLHKSFPPMDR